LLNEKNFFARMLECAENCYGCDYCENLMEEAVIIDSYFLDPADRIRVKENEKAIRIYKKIIKTTEDRIESF
jgi:hypothetical protein